MDCPFSFGAASFSPAVRSPVCIKEMCSAISCSIPLSAQAIAARTALRIARALEDPWAFKTGLEIPRKGVAPRSLGSSVFLISFTPSLTSSAANLVSVFLKKISLSYTFKNEPTPSMDLSITLPEKPSATITSAPPLRASLASILPMKFRCPASPASCSRA